MKNRFANLFIPMSTPSKIPTTTASAYPFAIRLKLMPISPANGPFVSWSFNVSITVLIFGKISVDIAPVEVAKCHASTISTGNIIILRKSNNLCINTLFPLYMLTTVRFPDSPALPFPDRRNQSRNQNLPDW